MGPGATGLLQSTFGNLPEFFVVIFALRSGQVTLAQASLLGSVFSNALLVLGLVIIVGARHSPGGVMRFGRRLPNDTATLMFPALLVIALLGLSGSAHDPASKHLLAISVGGAVVLLVLYGTWLWHYLRSDSRAQAAASPARDSSLQLSLLASCALLAVASVAALFVADWFVAALTPAIKILHISPTFAGLVIVAIAGNAVENAAGLTLAAKGKMDDAISVVKNSVSQIAVFLFPLLVLVSLLFATHLTFVLAPLYIGALAITVLAVWQITGDGEATVPEGAALIGLYLILDLVILYE
jgi:Ca2+:H+ antiporter